METIHILAVVNCFDHFLFGYVFGEGKLYDKTVYIGIFIEFAYFSKQFLFCYIAFVADE